MPISLSRLSLARRYYLQFTLFCHRRTDNCSLRDSNSDYTDFESVTSANWVKRACEKWDSNPHFTGFKSVTSACWVILTNCLAPTCKACQNVRLVKSIVLTFPSAISTGAACSSPCNPCSHPTRLAIHRIVLSAIYAMAFPLTNSHMVRSSPSEMQIRATLISVLLRVEVRSP